jgi:uncharacterized protein YfaT (DUF1175 family)
MLPYSNKSESEIGMGLTLQKQELVEELEQAAAAQNTTAEALMHIAISEFLGKIARQKIQAESVAFEKLHAQLITEYLGQYVALHNGEVVDHDEDVRALHLRIRKRFGRTPVLLRRVSQEIEPPDLVFRSPKLEPMAK